jgi:hypothetical protein
MKTSLLLIALPLLLTGRVACGAATDEVSQDVAAIGMLPKQRTAQRLAPSERNPFAFKPKEAAKAAAEETETQESKIRAIFKAMTVSGVRRGADGELTALAGDLILRGGEEVKPVLPEQTEVLMVSKIEPKKVELTFVENKDSTQPRTIVMPIKNQPLVAQKLFAQPQGSRNMYYPGARAAAAGVAAVLSVAGGSGAASVGESSDHAAAYDASAGDVPNGIGVITAPTPAPPAVGIAERLSFAALAPRGNPGGQADGTGRPAVQSAPSAANLDAAPVQPSHSAILEELGPGTGKVESSTPFVSPKAQPVFKAPPPPSAPRQAVPPAKSATSVPEPALPARPAEKPSPLRLAVPAPPPAKAPPLVE